MRLQNKFRLNAHGTTASKEILCGVTTFLTMSYILFVNPAIVSESGMPAAGVFVATALVSALCSFIMGLVANAPFGMAPGMGLVTFFAYVICGSMGFVWQEGLAITCAAGLAHILIMATGLRKGLVNAIPPHLKMAFGVGLGLFIGYIGLKNAGLLMFTTPPGHALVLDSGTVLSTAAAVPSFVGDIAGPQFIALTGLAVMLLLLAMERKTGEAYAALPIGILAATFVGIPMNVTNLLGVKFLDLSSLFEISRLLFSFFGDPGLLSILGDGRKLLLAALLVLILLVTNVMDSIGTIIGIGQVQKAEIFSEEEMRRFSRRGEKTRLDRALVCNSLGGGLGAVFGVTPATTYMESITGIVAGGRTGLAAVTVGVMFLICLPLSNLFSIVPAEAIAPALIVAGAFMMPLVNRIDWRNFEQAFPAFATVLCIPLTYSFVYGIAAGVLSHLIIQVSMGRWREIHPVLYAIAVIFLVIVGAETHL